MAVRGKQRRGLGSELPNRVAFVVPRTLERFLVPTADRRSLRLLEPFAGANQAAHVDLAVPRELVDRPRREGRLLQLLDLGVVQLLRERVARRRELAQRERVEPIDLIGHGRIMPAVSSGRSGTLCRVRPVLAAFFCAIGALFGAPLAAGAVAPVRWCGADRATTDRLSDRAGGRQIHVIYATPADGEDRFGALASLLATDVASIDAWWRGQDPERAPRFDLFDFPGCDSRFGRLDLSFARLPQPGSFYARPDQFERVAEALGNAPFEFNDVRKKYLVFYDGFGRPEEEDICGTAGGEPLQGGRFSYAVIFLRAGCPTEPGTGRGNAVVSAHELLHVLGALPLGAPHPCPGDDGHPCDSDLDLLWPFLVRPSIDEEILDVGRDDYYGHSGPWFDLQDSAWLLLAQRQVELTLAPTGRGAVGDGVGLACETTCVSEWDAGTQVSLTAEPAEGYLFRGWAGGCSGLLPECSLTLGASTTVSAVFRLALQITVAVAGRGSVRGSVACTRTCRRTFASGDLVALRARPARGWRFRRWTGPCRGARPVCSFRPSKSGTVRAVFARS
jgi:hypothetical protein